MLGFVDAAKCVKNYLAVARLGQSGQQVLTCGLLD